MKISNCFTVAFCSVVALTVSMAEAATITFSPITDYKINQADTGNPPAILPSGIELTNAAGGENRSIFHKSRQGVTEFTASFIYQVSPGTTVFDFTPSAAFVIHNDPRGAMAIGSSNRSGGILDIANSIAVTLELVGSGATSSSRSGVYTNGVHGGGSPTTDPLNLLEFNPVEVTLTYDGTFLNQQMVDTVTGESFSRSYLYDIPSIVGDTSAYVGFTAITQNSTTQRQSFTNFSYTGSRVPEPTGGLLLAAGLAAVVVVRRQMRKSLA